MNWYKCKKNMVNRDGKIVFSKGKKYAVQLEEEDILFISLKDNQRGCNEVCMFKKENVDEYFDKIVE